MPGRARPAADAVRRARVASHRKLRVFPAAGLERTPSHRLSSPLRRPRSASRSKPSREAVRESGRSVGSGDESVTGSANFFLELRGREPTDLVPFRRSHSLEHAARFARFACENANRAKSVFSNSSPLARNARASYCPPCTENGARVGRSWAWGLYAEAESQRVRGTKAQPAR
jgi:hypothetical protein